MNIIENINKRLSFEKEEAVCGGDKEILQLQEKTPIALPADYIEFLKSISGAGTGGVEFLVKDDDGEEEGSIYIWDAQMALEKYTEYKVYSHPTYEDIIDKIWLIGSDLGDLLYFYREGAQGFGLYRSTGGGLGFSEDKIADNITEFLVNGVGIEVAISL